MYSTERGRCTRPSFHAEPNSSGVTAIGANAQNAEKLFVLSGTIYDLNKAVIPKTEITFKNIDGQVFKTESFPDGNYKILIPFGKYTIEFYQDNFKPLIIKNFQNLSLLEKKFDVSMVEYCTDCGGGIYGKIDPNANKPFEIDFSKLKTEKNAAIISGWVTDEYGAIIPEILIIFKNEKGEEFKTKSSTEGTYSIKLPFGIYQVSARLNDYWKNKELTIEVKNPHNIRQGILLICTAKEKQKCSVE